MIGHEFLTSQGAAMIRQAFGGLMTMGGPAMAVILAVNLVLFVLVRFRVSTRPRWDSDK